DEHLALVGVEDAVDQPGQRAFAAAGLAYDGYSLAGVDAEGDALEHMERGCCLRRGRFRSGPVAARGRAGAVPTGDFVAEADVTELDGALDRPRDATFVLVQVGLGVDELQNTPRAGHAELGQL